MGDELGSRIRARRQRKGWTLKDLAGRTKLSVPYLSDLERRPGVNPTLDTLSVIADALDCEVADLVGETSGSPETRPLPPSVQRFAKTAAFERRVQRIATQTHRPYQAVVDEVLNFLATAPKRSSGDLSAEDWRRLLDFYAGVILEGEA